MTRDQFDFTWQNVILARFRYSDAECLGLWQLVQRFPADRFNEVAERIVVNHEGTKPPVGHFHKALREALGEYGKQYASVDCDYCNGTGMLSVWVRRHRTQGMLSDRGVQPFTGSSIPPGKDAAEWTWETFAVKCDCENAPASLPESRLTEAAKRTTAAWRAQLQSASDIDFKGTVAACKAYLDRARQASQRSEE